jgi:hypothetical protein
MTRHRTLTPAGPSPEPWDQLQAVMAAYGRQFRREVWTWRMDRDRIPALIGAMEAAMEAGEPLTCDEATAITGVSPPPLGAVG